MAVTFKTDQSYGHSLLPLFGVSIEVCQMAATYDVEIDQTSPGTFVVKRGGLTFGVIPVKGQAISLAKAGTLGPASKQAIKFQFEQAITKACSGAGDDYAAPKVKKMVAVDLESDTGVMMTLAQSEEYIKEVNDQKPFTGAKISNPQATMQQSPVKLYAATKLYAPVFGTSGGSIYHVAAMFKGCNMAIRVKGGTLSVRFEGPLLKGYANQLGDVGLDVKSNNDYASAHFSCGQGLLHKTVGAIIGRIGFKNVIDVADIAVLTGEA